MANTIYFSKTAFELIYLQKWIVTFFKAACKPIFPHRMRTIDPFLGMME